MSPSAARPEGRTPASHYPYIRRLLLVQETEVDLGRHEDAQELVLGDCGLFDGV